jgi:hypothetical protein
MTRTFALLSFILVACGDQSSPIDAAAGDGGGGIDAVDCDGGCAAENEACGSSEVDLDAGARMCGPGLVCCYPCGIPDCVDRCTVPCGTPGSGCQENGCPGPFP